MTCLRTESGCSRLGLFRSAACLEIALQIFAESGREDEGLQLYRRCRRRLCLTFNVSGKGRVVTFYNVIAFILVSFSLNKTLNFERD
jgi:hypothetical protein